MWPNAVVHARHFDNKVFRVLLQHMGVKDSPVTPVAPWSNGKGDVFATAQGYVPLIGKSYLDLIPAKK